MVIRIKCAFTTCFNLGIDVLLFRNFKINTKATLMLSTTMKSINVVYK